MRKYLGLFLFRLIKDKIGMGREGGGGRVVRMLLINTRTKDTKFSPLLRYKSRKKMFSKSFSG